MGRTLGDKIQDRGTISFSPINLRDMEKSIKNKEFKTVTDLVNIALRFYFENRDKNQDDMMAQFLQSPKGKDIIIACIQHYDAEKKQEMKK